MDKSFFLWSGLAAVFASMFFISRMLFSSKGELRAAASLEEQNKKFEDKSVLLRIARPLVHKYLIPVVEDMKLDKFRSKTRAKLASAGWQEQYTVDEFLAFKFLLIFVFPLGFLFFNWLGEFEYPLWYSLPIAVVGFFYLDLQISSKIKSRQNEIRMILPFVVDMLSMCVEAGMEFLAAVQKVIEKSKPNPLIDELNQVVRELRLGASQAEALRNMAERIDMIEISSLVSVVITARTMGASYAPVLRAQSEQIRLERLVRAEKIAGQMPTKLQLITVLFLLPSILLIAAAPLILGSLGGG